MKAAFCDVARINRTVAAATGARSLGMDEQDVVDVIQNLTVKDFDKTMPSMGNPNVWQDVYKPVVAGRELYVKFTQSDGGSLLLISFKDNTP